MTLPGIPSPRTWSPGDLVTVPRLRNDLEQAVALLGMRPYFAGQCDTGPSLASATYTVLPLDVELTDAWGGHLVPAAGGTDSGYWAPVPGWYLADVKVPFAYTGGTPAPLIAGLQGKSNGTSFGPSNVLAVNGSGATTVVRCTDLVQQVNAGSPGGSGDFIQALGRQDSGSPVNLSAAAALLPTVSVRWVCALTGTQPLPVPPLTAAPSPITSAWLNANLRDAVRFLTYPPVMRAHYTAGSSTLANTSLASPAVVPLTTTDFDNYGGFTTGASAHYTAPVAGRYLFAGQVNLASSSTATFYACGLLVNGSAAYWGGITRFAGSGLAGGAAAVKRLRLNAGDQVQLIAAQASGGAIAYNTGATNQTRFLAVWEGA